MIRWYPLNAEHRPIGPAFQAADATAAYDRACALYGERCERVQSLLSWEDAEAMRLAEERKRERRGRW
jgi:hypothetical protein